MYFDIYLTTVWPQLVLNIYMYTYAYVSVILNFIQHLSMGGSSSTPLPNSLTLTSVPKNGRVLLYIHTSLPNSL